MKLRLHLNRWLHPCDPLLEAWRDDPFVEWIRRVRRKSALTPRGLIYERLASPEGEMLIVMTSLLAVAMLFGRLQLGSLANTMSAFGTVVIISLLFFRMKNGRKGFRSTATSMNGILQVEGVNEVLYDLWMSGIRGRDILMALHVELSERRVILPYIYQGVIVFVLLIYFWEPTSHFGPVGVVSYLLVLVWLRMIAIAFRYGEANPLKSSTGSHRLSIPEYLEPAVEHESIAKGPERAPLVTSYLLMFLAAPVAPVILAYVPWNMASLIETLNAMPWGSSLVYLSPLLVQWVLMLMAMLALICIRIGSSPSIVAEVETCFPRIDELFDTHVRERIIQDPDAQRSL